MRAPISIALLVIVATPATASAYLDEARFSAPATVGGAGGRFFTGAPADGYTCTVCHRGGAEPRISLDGIPAEGWDPGMTYELSLLLPADARSAGAALEIADDRGDAQGALAVVPDAELEDADRCRTRERASTLVPLPGRLVARAQVCGAARVRVRWTAPASPVTDLRVFATAVRGNDSGDPTGDGAAMLAAPLRARGAPSIEGAMLGQRCSVGVTGRPLPAWMIVLGAGLLVARRRARGIALVAVALAAIALAGCGSREPSRDTPSDEPLEIARPALIEDMPSDLGLPPPETYEVLDALTRVMVPVPAEGDCALLAEDPASSFGMVLAPYVRDADSREVRCMPSSAGFICHVALIKSTGGEEEEYGVLLDLQMDPSRSIDPRTIRCQIAD